MDINLENYEIWFLDYAEGNLDESQVDILFSFLKKHPDLKSELEDFEIINIKQSQETFLPKDELKKTNTFRAEDFIAYHEGDLFESDMVAIDAFVAKDELAKKEFDQLGKMYLRPASDQKYWDKSFLKQGEESYSAYDYIAYHEGDLGHNDQLKLIAYLENNPQEQKIFDQYGSAYLVADGNIKYPQKGSLKKTEGKIIVLNWQVIAVAASILLLMTLLFFQGNEDVGTEENIVENTSLEDPKLDDKDFISNEALNDSKKAIALDRELDKSKNVNEENSSTYELENREKNPVATESPTINKVVQDHKENNLAKVSIDKKVNENIVSKNDMTQQTHEMAGKNNVDQKKKIIRKDTEPINTLNYQSIALENKMPNKLYKTIGIPELMPIDNNDLAQKKSEETINNSTSLLAFAEKKAAQVITDNKSNKLKLFDVIKKVGEKSRLYELKEIDNQRYNFKVANIEVDRKRKNTPL